MGGNKGTSQKWASNTTSDYEETNQARAPPQPDHDIKAYKEKLDPLRTIIKSMSKSSTSCTMSIRDKSSLNMVVHVSQGVWILDSRTIDHMIPFPMRSTYMLK